MEQQAAESVIVVYEPWCCFDLLAWIHRREARSLIAELRCAGYAVGVQQWCDHLAADVFPEPLLLRLSDPMMRTAAAALTDAHHSYRGPSSKVMECCYDKYQTYLRATAAGLTCPQTALANHAAEISLPLVLKPRRGSDSLGLRIIRQGSLPTHLRTDTYIVQEQIRGEELTIAVFGDRAGLPLRIFLPEGVPYSFSRKYLLRPRRLPIVDVALAERIRAQAFDISRVFDVNWAARIDLIHETATGRLYFLECDVAPLVGAQSAFAASLEAAGVARREQLRMLVGAAAPSELNSPR